MMEKIIYIDASYYGQGITGLSRFSDELIDEMLENNNGYKIVLFCFSNQKIKTKKEIEVIKIKLGISFFTYLTLFLPYVSRWYLKKAFVHPGIIHYHDSIRFPGDIEGFQSFVTIHDIASIVFPKFYVWRARILKRLGLKRLLNSNAKIISVSKTTKTDLENFDFAFKNRITTITEGVNSNFFIENESSYCNDNLNLKNFFLVVGSPHPRKNFINTYLAFKRFKERNNNEFKLVFVGKGVEMYFLNNNVFTDDNVVFQQNLTDSQLKKNYCNAFAYVNFSLHEGFGLTVLEAMANKCLVIGSDTTSVSENIGDEGLKASPNDIEDMASSFEKALKLDSKDKNEIINKAYEKVLKMNWKDVSDEYFKLFNSVINE